MHSPVTIRQGNVSLDGSLCVPTDAQGVIIFAHGSGSGRLSPRNQKVARHLEAGGYATLLLDLLDSHEAHDRRKIFDIDLLADRLLLAQDWLSRHPITADLQTGYFGASTGAGAALQAAARMPQKQCALVSRGGRLDLAGAYLTDVTAPVLLLVGGKDESVIEMNRESLGQLTCQKQLVIIPEAGHLFEEPGTIEQVAEQALRWFQRHLPRVHSKSDRLT